MRSNDGCSLTIEIVHITVRCLKDLVLRLLYKLFYICLRPILQRRDAVITCMQRMSDDSIALPDHVTPAASHVIRSDELLTSTLFYIEVDSTCNGGHSWSRGPH